MEPRPADAAGAGSVRPAGRLRGGCTLDAAEEICGANVDAITSLVDKSLLRRTDDGYWMLETIREFAAEQLDQLPDARSLQDGHAAWYVALAERARPELRSREARTWLERLDAEQAKRVQRSSICWRAVTPMVRCGSRVRSGCTGRREGLDRGPRFLAAALSLGGDTEPARLVNALSGAAFLALWQGEVDEGEELADRLFDLSEHAELEHGKAIAIDVLAIVARQRETETRRVR